MPTLHLLDNEQVARSFLAFHGVVRSADEHDRIASIFRNRAFLVLRVERPAACWSVQLVRPANVHFDADELQPMLRKFLQNRGFTLERFEPLVAVESRCWRIHFQTEKGQVGLGIKYGGYRAGVFTECREQYSLAEHECYYQHSRRPPGTDERFRRDTTNPGDLENEEIATDFKKFYGLTHFPNLNSYFGRLLFRAGLRPLVVECLTTGTDWRIAVLCREPDFFSASKRTGARFARLLSSGSADITVKDLTLKRRNYRLEARFSGPQGEAGLSLRGGSGADQPLRAVTARHIEQFLGHRLDEGSAPKTAIVDIKTLGSALRRAENFGYIDKNPVPAVKLPKAVSSERAVFVPNEISLLIGFSLPAD